MFDSVRRRVRRGTAGAASVCLIAMAAGASAGTLDDQARALASAFKKPAVVPAPAYNPPNDLKIDLGQRLFHDETLSVDGVTSCATCHRPDHGFEEPVAVGTAAHGGSSGRHTPTLWAVAFAPHFGWTGRKPTLEAAVLSGFANSHGLGGDLSPIAAAVRDRPVLRDLAEQAFPGRAPGSDAAVLAIAAFMRTLTGGDSAFDAWLAGDAEAMDAASKRGFVLFNTKARCAACHGGWTFSDYALHDIGLQQRGPDDPTRVKTPTLRDIANRAPYLHDGRAPDLAAVIQHYVAGRRPRASVHSVIEPLGLSDDDQKDLIAFLETLTEPLINPKLNLSTN